MDFCRIYILSALALRSLPATISSPENLYNLRNLWIIF
jgi:hypothetical protein